jgi:hypothetical protein
VSENLAALLPFVVVGGLPAGFASGRRPADNERMLRRRSA